MIRRILLAAILLTALTARAGTPAVFPLEEELQDQTRTNIANWMVDGINKYATTPLDVQLINWFDTADTVMTNILPVGMLGYTIDTMQLRVGDGCTPGGLPCSPISIRPATRNNGYDTAPMTGIKGLIYDPVCVIVDDPLYAAYRRMESGMLSERGGVIPFATHTGIPGINSTNFSQTGGFNLTYGTDSSGGEYAGGYPMLLSLIGGNSSSGTLLRGTGGLGLQVYARGGMGGSGFYTTNDQDVVTRHPGGAGGPGFVISGFAGNGGATTTNKDTGEEYVGIYALPAFTIASKSGNSWTTNRGGRGGEIRASGGNASINGKRRGYNGGIISMQSGTYGDAGCLILDGGWTNGGTLQSVLSTYVSSTIFSSSSPSGPILTTDEITLLDGFSCYSNNVAGLSKPAGGLINSMDQADQPLGYEAKNILRIASMAHEGRVIRFKLSGYMKTSGTPMLNVKLKIGSAIMFETGPQQLAQASGSGQQNTWTYSGEIVSTHTFGYENVSDYSTYYIEAVGQASFQYNTSHSSPLQSISVPKLDSTRIHYLIDNTIDVTAAFSEPGNTLICTCSLFELVN